MWLRQYACQALQKLSIFNKNNYPTLRYNPFYNMQHFKFALDDPIVKAIYNPGTNGEKVYEQIKKGNISNGALMHLRHLSYEQQKNMKFFNKDQLFLKLPDGKDYTIEDPKLLEAIKYIGKLPQEYIAAKRKEMTQSIRPSNSSLDDVFNNFPNAKRFSK